MKHVIEFRNGSFFKDLDADNGVALEHALVFDSKQAAVEFMDAHQWIYMNGGMALAQQTALEREARCRAVEGR